jgi:hypothetical protein
MAKHTIRNSSSQDPLMDLAGNLVFHAPKWRGTCASSTDSCYNAAMPGRIFFRDERATVTATHLIVGLRTFSLDEILAARGVKRRSWWPLLLPNRFALVIKTASGDREILRARNGYMVFQLAMAIETALREARGDNAKIQISNLKQIPTDQTRTNADPGALPSSVQTAKVFGH